MSSAVILSLRPKECPQQDIDHIASIYRNLSASAARDVVARALGELAEMMAAMADQIAAHDMDDLAQRLKRLQRMARNLGLLTLSAVATDLGKCLQAGDVTAFAAVWARLLRLLDCTLSYDRDMQDFTAS